MVGTLTALVLLVIMFAGIGALGPRNVPARAGIVAAALAFPTSG